jgi:hypothetical protein
MELFGVLVIIAVVGGLLFRLIGRNRSSGGIISGAGNSFTSQHQYSSTALTNDWITNPSYWWMSGNIYYDDSLDNAVYNCPDDDWISNPICSHIPGNIYYHDSCSCTGSDWMSDPCCSHMPGNIHHNDYDDVSSLANSSWDTDDVWSSHSGSSFDDD